MKRQILLSLLLALTMTNVLADNTVLPGFEGPVWYDFRADNYDGGNGSKDEPYLIATAEQLAKLAYEVNVNGAEGYYKLTADINLNKRESAGSPRVLWVPIGISSSPFKGTLTNPDGYVIKDMMIRVNGTQTTTYFGLFGRVEGKVDGIRMEGAEMEISGIDADYSAGLLCGYLYQGGIANCRVQGDYNIITANLLGNSVNIGGLVGEHYNYKNDRLVSCLVKTTIQLTGDGSSQVKAGGVVGDNFGKVVDCHAIVNMTANNLHTSSSYQSHIGGVVGNMGYGPVKFCSASGKIIVDANSRARTGGLVGALYQNQQEEITNGGIDYTIKHCATTVTIAGGRTLGGLIGYCYITTERTIDLINNASASYIDARDANNAGGLIGYLEKDRMRPGEVCFGAYGNMFCGTMTKPTSGTHYGTILGWSEYVSDYHNLTLTPGSFIYNHKMCNMQTNGRGWEIGRLVERYSGTRPHDDEDGFYGSYGVCFGTGTLGDPTLAISSESYGDDVEMCFTDNYVLCDLILYITNDKKTLYSANDVTVDFVLEDFVNRITGERLATFTVPDNLTCVKIEDKHIYPVDPGEMIVTIKWNGLQREVHLDITYGLDWEGGENNAFEGGEGTEEDPYLIHNADQLFAATHDEELNQSDKNFKLACDIFFNTHLIQRDGTPREGAINWTPSNFQAHLDGNGKTIYGLYVKGTPTDERKTFGLFADLSGTVKNLALVDSHVEVSSGSSDVSAGLLCGKAIENATVSNCLFHGNVVSNARRGGVFGVVEGDFVSIADIFSNVHVSWPGWPSGSPTYDGGGVAYSAPSYVLQRCFSTGRVDYTSASEGIANTSGLTDCYYDAQMMDNPQVVREYAMATRQILSKRLYAGKDNWQQTDDETYPMLKSFADSPYGKVLAMPVVFDGTDADDQAFHPAHYESDDRAGNVNYIFEFPTEDVEWSALHEVTYLDVINDCGAASLVEKTDNNVEVLIAEAQNVLSQCTRARRTMPLNLRSGLTHFRFKDPVAQSAAETAFDKVDPVGILTLRELVEATKDDFSVFNAHATGLKQFPEFRYFTSTKTVEEGMLSGLNELYELQLPKKLEAIDTKAFSGCSSLEELTLPPTFSTMRMGALYESGVKDILVSPKHLTMESINGALYKTDTYGKLHFVLYPPGRGEAGATIGAPLLHSIDDYAFYKVPALENVYIDNCLPEGNMVIPSEDGNEIPMVHETNGERLHVFVNDGSYDRRGGMDLSLLYDQYVDDYFWGTYYYDNDRLHIYYPLNMTSAGWATLYIGFPTELPEGFNAYVVKEINEDTHLVTLKNIGRVIPATTPVVIKNAGGLQPGVYPLVRFEDVDRIPDVAKYNNRLVGTFIGQEGKWGIEVNQETSITGSVLTLGRNTQGVVGFYKYNGEVVPPYRAYLPFNTIIEGAKSFSFVLDDVVDDLTTLIERPVSDTQQPTLYYDMMGRPLKGKPVRRGVYIRNGKKVVVK